MWHAGPGLEAQNKFQQEVNLLQQSHTTQLTLTEQMFVCPTSPTPFVLSCNICFNDQNLGMLPLLRYNIRLSFAYSVNPVKKKKVGLLFW